MVTALKRPVFINLLCLVSASLAIYFEMAGNREIYVFLKPLTTLLIMSHLFFLPNTSFRNGILAALFFCLVGDVLLLFEAYFVYGLATFLVGHVLFALAFIRHKGFYLHWGSFVALFGIATALFFWLKPDLGAFMVPVALYVLVISFMAWQGIGTFLRDRAKPYRWIALAVLLFMFSDTLIAIAKFKSPFYLSSLVILGTYWLSIALIANATYQIVTKQKG